MVWTLKMAGLNVQTTMLENIILQIIRTHIPSVRVHQRGIGLYVVRLRMQAWLGRRLTVPENHQILAILVSLHAQNRIRMINGGGQFSAKGRYVVI